MRAKCVNCKRSPATSIHHYYHPAKLYKGLDERRVKQAVCEDCHQRYHIHWLLYCKNHPTTECQSCEFYPICCYKT